MDKQSHTVERLVKALGDTLVSIFSYEQGTKMLVVVEKASITVLHAIDEATERTPMVLRYRDITDGTDVFPIDLLHIKADAQILYGKDVVSDLGFAKDKLRRQLEFELRSKLIRLRTRFLDNPKRAPQQILATAHETLLPILQGLSAVRMQRIRDVPVTWNDAVAMVEELYGIDASILRKLYKPKRALERQYVQELIEFLTTMCDSIDTLLVNKQ